MLPGQSSHNGLTCEDALTLQDGYTATSYMLVAQETSHNLTKIQKELLIWHWKLGHAQLPWIEDFAVIPKQTVTSTPYSKDQNL